MQDAEARDSTPQPYAVHPPLEADLNPPKLLQGKDEMNLAEFPLSAISERVDPGQKTLTFEDRIWDESRGEMITRKLTVTASDHYGLPTALDDEVILGLVQLSKLQGFADRHVSFTRYQLIRLLGWRDDSQSYERIEKSLNRWVGVTLYYENAWRDKKNGSWVDEKFHLIDNVTLYDREKAAKARQRAKSDGSGKPATSSFSWNEVVFRSFSAGNLKSLDFDFYKGLHSAIAKRLFRFLDKRFFHRGRWEFNLKEVSWEHIGMSKKYDTANLKRKLMPAIRELEAKGFLQPMSEAERFQKVRSGEWRVIFERARPKRTAVPGEARAGDDEVESPLKSALVQRGVTESTARETVAAYPTEQIQTQLEVFDWLVAQKDPKVSRNPAGFLVTAIKGEYVAPKGFVTRDEQEQRAAQAADRKRKAAEREAAAKAEADAKIRGRDAVIRNFWESLSDVERAKLEGEAVALANGVQQDVIHRGGPLAETVRKSLLDAYALNLLRQAA